MKDYSAEFVYKPLGLQSEWGCSQHVRFAGPGMVTLHDSKGNEIEIPKCEKCDNYKNQIIGKESFMWYCPYCEG
jgi:hypothetical protein